MAEKEKDKNLVSNLISKAQQSVEEIDSVAKLLLEKRFFLTALEFQTELIESGKGSSRLKEFFSNPNNFEFQAKLDPLSLLRKAPSVLTLDSIDDFARYSDDDAHETDERIAVLEFELRKAKETIYELRQSVTEMASESKKNPLNERRDSNANQFELRTLNFLVNEYLLRYNHKLTSITFADEVGDQDLDDWEDVGLNIAQPPDLLHLFRDYSHHIIDPESLRLEELRDMQNELELLRSRCEEMKIQITKLNQTNSKLMFEINELNRVQSASKVEGFKTESHLKLKGSLSDNNLEKIFYHQKKSSEGKIAESIFINTDKIEIHNEKNEDKIENNKAIIDHQKLDLQISNYQVSDQQLLDQQSLDQHSLDQQSLDQQSLDQQTLNQQTSVLQESLDLSIADVCNETEKSKDLNENFSNVDGLTLKDNIRFVSNIFIDVLFTLVKETPENTVQSSTLIKQVSYSSKSPVEVIANSLPKIVPNVLLNKREELIPLILCAARYHGDSKVRDDLLHMLFNLIKRPEYEQRKIIIDGFVEFASSVESTRIESELLPQCWEQINHKFPERRLLVSETCGFISPYLPVELQSSLIFSMLSQMLQEDRSEIVRRSVIKSLAIVISAITDASKYLQAYSLFECGLLDIVDEVVSTTVEIFLPALSVWACEINKLQSHFIPELFKKSKTALQSWQEAHLSENADANMTMLDSENKYKKYIDCLVKTVSILFVNCIITAPFKQVVEVFSLSDDRLPLTKNSLFNVDTIIGDNLRTNKLVKQFDNFYDGESVVEQWEEVQWVCEQCLPQVCEMCGLLFYSTHLVNQLVSFMFALCQTFGKPFTSSRVVPFFEKQMRNTGAAFFNDTPPVCSPLLTVFLCGVLPVYKGSEQAGRLCTFIKQCLLTISTQHLSPQFLVLSLNILSKDKVHHVPLLDMLKELLFYPVAEVRTTTVLLLEVLAKRVSNDLLISQVASAVLTLTNDKDLTVRLASIPALVCIVEGAHDKLFLDKISIQLQNLLDDEQLQKNTIFLKVIVQTITKMISNADVKFRDEFLLPRLKSISEINQLIQDSADRLEVIEELISSQNAALCCYLSREVILSYILPVLRLLEVDLKNVSPETLDSVVLMIKDAENKCDDDKSSVSSGISASASLKLFGNISSRFKKKNKDK
ncbi:RAB11-binding protein RELCH isoform X2 [Hydra vulgaris]|uniref:RAB11-binding protein RELCH isoform X2 n=1 Tax=Hydra vulgaris TaxID=6087 RepID=A0ABM4DEI1_HYDVU